MAEFIDEDLSGSHFERVSLQSADLYRVNFTGATMRRVILSDVKVRAALFANARMTGVEMVNLDISGEIVNVVVNGVDIAPLIDEELNRRMPDRAKMRPDTVEGFQEAWEVLERLWVGTVEKARALPAEALHERVNGEWSFIDTLRHLDFATAAWIGRVVLGNPSPWHPLDLPWEEAPVW